MHDSQKILPIKCTAANKKPLDITAYKNRAFIRKDVKHPTLKLSQQKSMQNPQNPTQIFFAIIPTMHTASNMPLFHRP